MLLNITSSSVAPALTDLTTTPTYATFYNLYFKDTDIEKQQQGTYKDMVCKYLNFDGFSTWNGIFIMNKYVLATLISSRLREIINKGSFEAEWSILHKVYCSISTVKQWLTTVEGRFTSLPVSFQDMTQSLVKVCTARISISLQFNLPSFDNINDQNWLAVKDTLNQALASRGLTDLSSLQPQDETFRILDKMTGNALRLALRDSNVSSITLNETRFSTMYESLCLLFDNQEVVNKKASQVKELTSQIKYSEKEGGIVKYLNRKATGFSSASRLGSALSTTEITESLKLGLRGHPRMQSVMDSSAAGATTAELVHSLRRTEEIVVGTLTPRVRRLGSVPKAKGHSSTQKGETVISKEKRKRLPNEIWKFVKADSKRKYRTGLLSFDDMEKDARIAKSRNDSTKPSSKGKGKKGNKRSRDDAVDTVVPSPARKKAKKATPKTSSPVIESSNNSETPVSSKKKKAKSPKSKPKKKKGTKVDLPTDAATKTKVKGKPKTKVASTRRISTGDSDSKARDEANAPELGEVGIEVGDETNRHYMN